MLMAKKKKRIKHIKEADIKIQNFEASITSTPCIFFFDEDKHLKTKASYL